MADADNDDLHADLIIHLEGRAVYTHRIALQDLALLSEQLQTAVNRVARVLQERSTGRQSGRLRTEIERACTLEVVALRQGSVELLCDLPRTAQDRFSADLGEEALLAFVDGIEFAAHQHTPLPAGYDRSVLAALGDTGKLFDRGIDRIAFSLRTNRGEHAAVYTPLMRGVFNRRSQEAERTLRTVEGRVVMVDIGRPKLKCRIQMAHNRSIACTFDGVQRDGVLEAVNHYVRATGYATENRDQIRTLALQEIQILDLPAEGDTLPHSYQPFFAPTATIDQLASQQGVEPISRFDTLLGDFWPEEESTDEFLAALRGWREETERHPL